MHRIVIVAGLLLVAAAAGFGQEGHQATRPPVLIVVPRHEVEDIGRITGINSEEIFGRFDFEDVATTFGRHEELWRTFDPITVVTPEEARDRFGRQWLTDQLSPLSETEMKWLLDALKSAPAWIELARDICAEDLPSVCLDRLINVQKHGDHSHDALPDKPHKHEHDHADHDHYHRH